MSEQQQLSAQVRTDVGKGASRRLRRIDNRVPGILYGGEQPPVPLTLNTNELNKAMQFETFYSQVMELNVDGDKQSVIVRDLQRHPAAPRIMHIDFLRVDANKAIQVSVPLHFTNEDNCAGVKLGGGVINHILNEVEISALPADLPEFIEVDMLEIELGGQVHLSDIKLPTGVTIVALQHGDSDHDLNVASVQATRGGSDAEEDTEATPDAAPEEGGETAD